MKKILLFVMSMVLLLNLAFAHEHDFTETKQLIDSGISCDKLTDEQLEAMGDYYMEQMHPGEAHETMDKMMGGEGSDSLKQMHIQMARRIYCNEDVSGMMGGGMMGNNMMSSGMMGGGMMGNNMMGSGMMGGGMMGNNMMGSGGMGNSLAYYGYNGLWNALWLIFLIGVIALIIWFIYKLTKKGKEFETPVDILHKRYAKGEINKKQFDEMKKELKW